MSKCFLKLDTRRALKDGTFPVKIAVSYGTNLYLNTDVSVQKDDWDPAKKEVIGPQAKRLNNLLSSTLTRVANRVLNLREDGRFSKMSTAALKRALTATDPDAVEEDSTPKPSLVQIARMCLQTKDAESTRQLYLLTIAKLEAFIKDPDGFYIEDMTKAWLHDFQVSIGGKVNSQAIHMRNLRHICNFALDEELTTFYPFRKYHIKTEETMKKALSIEKVRTLRKLPLTGYMAEHRDIFMMLLYLRGINIGDLSRLTKESIRDGRIEYRRSKTGRLFSVKMEPEMEEIIRRLPGEKHLLAPFDRYKSYKDYNHHLNDCLKKMSDESGQLIEEDLSSNWARHTWATIAAELDISDPTITLGMGHATAGHKTTAIYIKRDMAKVDEANRKVIDCIWA